MGKDRITPEKRSKIMSAIRSKDTKVEKILRSELFKRGLRFRKHYPIKGKPDIVFPTERIAIFVDGDFWHGREWRKLKPKLKNDYWISKIKGNRKRDRRNTYRLKKEGWKVIRLWEYDVRKNYQKCVGKIMKARRKNDHKKRF